MYVGVAGGGPLTLRHEKLDNGTVIPNGSLPELHENRRCQIQNQVEFGVRAEEFGYDCVYLAEHHLRLLGGSSPNPIQVQSAIAQRTDEIDLLQLANILPWHEPVRLAEQLAMLDIMSEGRAQVGVGRGSTEAEAEVFGQYWGGSLSDEVKNIVSFREKFDVLKKAWTSDLMSHHGEFHSIPPKWTEWDNPDAYFYLKSDRTDYNPDDYFEADFDSTLLKSVPIFPQPYQEPHPQFWRPATSERAIKWSARNGVNGVCLCHDFEQVSSMIDLYHDTAAEADWPDHRPELSGTRFKRGWADERKRGLIPMLDVFNTEIATEEEIEHFWIGRDFLMQHSKEESVREQARNDTSNKDGVIVGSTDEIIDDLLTLIDEVGYDELGVFVQFQQFGMSKESVINQMRAFSERVVPELEE
jgi:alkanesulfonate monooxygenase SsuD/methylene tetrahydromethanopterin reductase-like flavin-dependent oxidoreductase (luciferase family)